MADPAAVREFWQEQARLHRSDPRATTPDYWLRELEIRTIGAVLAGLGRALRVLDIGCGNGYSTLKLAAAQADHRFLGGDYSDEMIHAAEELQRKAPADVAARAEFKVMDVLALKPSEQFDVVITDRCLINLTSDEAQWEALERIAGALKPAGHAILVENFAESHDRLNDLRHAVGLPPIPIRWHNRYFREAELLSRCGARFDVAGLLPLTSTYYVVTRVVYSRLCQLEGREPDYDDPIYEIATNLPMLGDYGPVKLVHLIRNR